MSAGFILGLVLTAVPAVQTDPVHELAGVVRHRTSEEPIASASVVLEDPRGSAFAARSGADGRFSISQVPPGRYSFQVNVNGYARPRYGGWPSQLEVAGDTRDLVVEMVATGVITGVVLTPAGRPMSRMFVQAMRSNADGELEIVESTLTDDRGRYRLFFLPPGGYYVRSQLDFIRPFASGLTYYPGVLDVGLADEVRVEAGTEAVGIDFTIRSSLNYQVSGTIRLPESAETFVRMFIARDVAGIRDAPAPVVTPRYSGSEFVIPGVRNGEYDAIAYIPDAEGAIHFGRARFSVAGQDVTGVDLRLERAVDLSGRLRETGPSDPVFDGPIRLALEPRDPLPSMLLPREVTLDPDGRFTVPSVVAGTYDVILSGALTSDAYAEVVLMGDRDISASGLTIRAGAAASMLDLGVRLGFGGRVEGVVQADDGNTAGYTQVTLVPVSPGGGGFASQQRVVEADGAGRFAIRGVPPGEYKLFSIGVMEELARTPSLDPGNSDRGVSVTVAQPGSRATGIVVPLGLD